MGINRRTFIGAASGAAVCATYLRHGIAQSNEPIRLASIDPQSGMLALSGDATFKYTQFGVHRANAKGGALGRKLEITAFDNKANAQESVLQLRAAIDQGVRFIVQGNGTHVALALIEAIEKHNRRNPGQEVMFINIAAVDPVLTNAKCSFWHFQYDLSSAMKIRALTQTMATNQEIKKVYLVNQDYAFGRTCAEEFQARIKELRPDIEVVGSDLHPLGRVTDFSPYINKVRQSGAQAVFSANWGSDLALLVRAGAGSGLDVDYYTFYGASVGVPAAIGPAGIGRVIMSSTHHDNLGVELQNAELLGRTTEFRERYNMDLSGGGYTNMMLLLAQSINAAGSMDMKKIALEFQNGSIDTPTGIYKFGAGHQGMGDLFVARLERGVRFEAEGVGGGWKTIRRFNAEELVVPNSCQMQMPD